MRACAELERAIERYYAFYPPRTSMEKVRKAKERYLRECGGDWDALQEEIDAALVKAMKVKARIMPELFSWKGKPEEPKPVEDNVIPFFPRARKVFPQRERRGQTRPNRAMRAQARG